MGNHRTPPAGFARPRCFDRDLGVGDEVTVDSRVVRHRREFELLHRSPSNLIWREHEVPIDNHADRKAGPDGDRRLDVEIAANDLLAGLVEAIGAPLLRRRTATVLPTSPAATKLSRRMRWRSAPAARNADRGRRSSG